jgi:hypothetical protein
MLLMYDRIGVSKTSMTIVQPKEAQPVERLLAVVATRTVVASNTNWGSARPPSCK